MVNGETTTITRTEAHGIARRLRFAVERSSTRELAGIIRATLTPDDLATLETLAGLVKEKAENVV